MNQQLPKAYQEIKEATIASGFDMASDVLTCSLLRTLASAKPAGNFLELGTGTGLSTTWILDGMDQASTLTSIDNDDKFLSIAKAFLSADNRLDLILTDGSEWIVKNKQNKYDYIFADTWHGKYLLLDEALSMLKKGGLYIIDDMLPQSNWPEGHQEKAIKLMNDLESRTDLHVTTQVWATGIVIAVKIREIL
ncbi:methyltransferase domain-containing protein [Pedobacter petrophilus]|uniref:Methyltransferase domain-containing protein n=1 Tax=Pedobacter petrophilus TaxID=1908241 RepID=A0A7K0FT86_9SPHI|nr:class I SAM-dependent methyltransferase [Pedobacter petrophilus]MRX74837.1 methyltransferase domain-containing protein [Pedobacter petrophilus]